MIIFLSYDTSSDDLSKVSSSDDGDPLDVLSNWNNSLRFMIISFFFYLSWNSSNTFLSLKSSIESCFKYQFFNFRNMLEMNFLRLKPIFQNHHLLLLGNSFSWIHVFIISISIRVSCIFLRVSHTFLVVLQLKAWKNTLVLNALVVKYLTWSPSCTFPFSYVVQNKVGLSIGSLFIW